MIEPTAPSRVKIADTPAMTTTATTAIQPRPWISMPMSSPGAPPKTADVPIRFTRSQYGPPVSIEIESSAPRAGSSASSRRPVANATASGTHTANTARAIVPQGMGAFLGRTTSVSQPAPRRQPSRGPRAARRKTPHKNQG